MLRPPFHPVAGVFMHLGLMLTIYRRSLAQWQLGLTLILCLLMMPLPIPMMHRHDEITSPEELACHLATRHQLSICDAYDVTDAVGHCVGATPHESHWHFVMPTRDPSDDASRDELPSAEHSFLAFADDASAVVSSPRDHEVELSTPIMLTCCFIEILDDHSSHPNSCSLAADAVQASRCALGCVMRC